MEMLSNATCSSANMCSVKQSWRLVAGSESEIPCHGLLNNKRNIEFPHDWSFVRDLHRWTVGSPNKKPIMGKVFSCHDFTMIPHCYLGNYTVPVERAWTIYVNESHEPTVTDNMTTTKQEQQNSLNIAWDYCIDVCMMQLISIMAASSRTRFSRLNLCMISLRAVVQDIMGALHVARSFIISI